MDQSFPPVSLGGMPREIRDMICGYLVKEEKVIYHKVIIAGTRPVSFSSFTIRGYGQVCRQFRAEYAETLNRHIQHITIVGDLNGDKLFDTNRYRCGFRAKLALMRPSNTTSWQCHPVLPSLRHLPLKSSSNRMVFEAFQGNYAMPGALLQKLSISFESHLSTQARQSVRHQEAAIYDNIFSVATLQDMIQLTTTDVHDVTQIQNKRFKPSSKPIVAVRDITGRRNRGPNPYHDIFKALCDIMMNVAGNATWPAICCRHQNCGCFAEQARTYLQATLLRCRGYPNTLYAFDTYLKRDDPKVADLDGLRLTRHYRKQIRDSWISACNRGFEIFTEAGSCHMDCEQCSLRYVFLTGQH